MKIHIGFITLFLTNNSIPQIVYSRLYNAKLTVKNRVCTWSGIAGEAKNYIKAVNAGYSGPHWLIKVPKPKY